jgi:type II restriction enzyme
MQTALPTRGLEGYSSNSQRARVATEAWGLEELYCPACVSDRVKDLPTNTRAHDFACWRCPAIFQLKSQSRPLSGRMLGSNYTAFMREMREDRTPNLFAMHYNKDAWGVQNLIVVPHFAIPFSAVAVRKALSEKAKRHKWVGYTLILSAIPSDAKIPVICEGLPSPRQFVRDQFQKLRALEKVDPESRGWILDVLNVLRRIGKAEFVLQDVYAYESHLQRLHPRNNYIQPKIRQQLQELRNAGFVEFLGRGKYRML